MVKKSTQTWFSEEELRAEITGQNPWWGKEGAIPDTLVKPFHRSGYFEALRFVDNGTNERAVMILGARRVGKTRILYQLVKHLLDKSIDPRSILFLSLDNPLFQFPSLRQLLEHAATCIGKSTSDFRYIFFDEIQYKKDWAKWLKTFVQEPLKRRFIVTGSAAATLQAQGPDEGVGRWIDVHVPTMSFSEYLVLCGREPGPPQSLFSLENPTGLEILRLEQLGVLKSEFEGYLLRGGFPELADHKLDVDSAQRLLSDDIAEKVLNRDMAALYGVRQLLSLKQIFLAVAFRSSSIIDRKKLSDDFQVSPVTVNQYLSYLQKAFLLCEARRFSPSENRVVKSHPKFYVTDAALRNAVLRRGEAILENPIEMGPVVETAVFNHLYQWARQRLATVYYWRNPATNHEVDIVIKTQEAKLIPVEVKYQNQIRADDFAGIDEFCDKYGPSVHSAYMVTKDALDIRDIKGKCKCHLIPASQFVWQIAWSFADPNVMVHIREYLEKQRIWTTANSPTSDKPLGPPEEVEQ